MRGISLYGEAKPFGTEEEQNFQKKTADASLPLIDKMLRVGSFFVEGDTNSFGLDEEALYEGVSIGNRLRAYIDETRLCNNLQAAKREVFIGRMAEQIILGGGTVTPQAQGTPEENARTNKATDTLRRILTKLFLINTIPPQQAEFHRED
jgi:hypothetical protein